MWLKQRPSKVLLLRLLREKMDTSSSFLPINNWYEVMKLRWSVIRGIKGFTALWRRHKNKLKSLSFKEEFMVKNNQIEYYIVHLLVQHWRMKALWLQPPSQRSHLTYIHLYANTSASQASPKAHRLAPGTHAYTYIHTHIHTHPSGEWSTVRDQAKVSCVISA